MAFKITLDAAVAKRNGWTGTRRRTCTFADGRKERLVFGREPVELPELPPEVAADPMLHVAEIPDGAPAEPAEAPAVATAAPRVDPIAAMTYPQLVAACAAKGLPTGGKKAALAARLSAAKAGAE